ncbi:MAG: BNR repeat-containing protein [Saprospiraceae bacterium]|nr:BNR repeat-containing protein [Saprospiraceae bacterium]
MQKPESLIILLLFIFLYGACNSVTQSKIGLGWAKNSVNTVVFRKNALTTHQEYQYTAYYDSSGYVILAKRKLSSTKWEVNKTNLKGRVADAHNTISIMVDGDGYLHLTWDHHNNALNYCKSMMPNSLQMSQPVDMIGAEEEDVTYPEFHRLPNGDLLFMYRQGVSGRGNLVINRYYISTKTWQRLHSILIDGEGERNAYWQAFVDEKGIIHLSWVWRETWDVATNHDLCYARSVDGGKTWQKSTNEVYQLPIKQSTAEYAALIPMKSELINQTSMYADRNGNPHIVSYWTPQGTMIPQYHIIYNTGNGWRTQQVSSRTSPFSLSGGGTKKIPIARPQLVLDDLKISAKEYLSFRDEERGNKVSISVSEDLNEQNWQTFDVAETNLGSWEPNYDTELWKRKYKLHLFVQRTGQGDGEQLEELSPQNIFILSVDLNKISK